MRIFIVKLVIGVAGLVLLVKLGSIDLAVFKTALAQPHLVILAFVCLLATVPLATLRWWTLINALGISVGFRWALNAVFISSFFHTFLPGAYGGDMVRLAIAYRAAGGFLNQLTFSIVIDRLTGLLALIFLALSTVSMLPVAHANHVELITVVVAGGGFAVLAAALVLGDRVSALIGRLPAPIGPTLARILSGAIGVLRLYLSRPGLLFGAVAISVVQYVLVLAALMILGRSMAVEGLSPAGYVLAGSWSLVANSVPLTPGGFGIGEAAFSQLAQALAAPSSSQESFGTVFLAMRVLTVMVGTLGILPWLLHRFDVSKSIAVVQGAQIASEQG